MAITIIIIAMLEVMIMAKEIKITTPMMETMAIHKMEITTLVTTATMEIMGTVAITHLITPVTVMETQIMEMVIATMERIKITMEMVKIKITAMEKIREILMILQLQVTLLILL
jgi:hypothetical protein